MAKELVCPACGNRGEAKTDEKVGFDMRGQLQGKTVWKCRECGAGLLLGLFTGRLFGKPKIIPEALWQRIEEIWQHEYGATEK